ncbi:MAG: SUMF1/EgtB/PvdO family nonheme iron enzyme [Planctomycetota bacterium]|nr:SUMF1/EgtB/PvdO family nonheme iron enzyme [Planctomycetota bacterium]
MVKVNEQATMDLNPETVRQYVWARYIDNVRPRVEIDEDQALKLFEDHYSKHPLNQDDECFYFGILLYERAFSAEDATRARYLVKAKEVFEVYRRVSGETEWDVIEDRYADVCDIIESEGLLEKVQTAASQAPKVEGMVLVPAGPFPYGLDRTQVHLEPYYIDVYPVTNADYKKFLTETSYRKPEIWGRRPDLSADELPVTGVSWMDALQFCKWAKKSLPTAEQWEKAARGHEGYTYPWGDEPPTPDRANYKVHIEDDGRLQNPRRYEKWKSPFGVVGMVGTVWEWTNTSYPEEEGAQIIKGGSYEDPADPDFLSAYASIWANKKEKNELIGFRCTKTLDMSS